MTVTKSGVIVKVRNYYKNKNPRTEWSGGGFTANQPALG